MEYDALPEWFIAHTLYDYETRRWVDPILARQTITRAGFVMVPQLYFGKIENYDFLETLANQNTTFAPEQKREGVYIKIGDGRFNTNRFKMVREGFKQGGLWSDTELKKNTLLRA